MDDFSETLKSSVFWLEPWKEWPAALLGADKVEYRGVVVPGDNGNATILAEPIPNGSYLYLNAAPGAIPAPVVVDYWRPLALARSGDVYAAAFLTDKAPWQYVFVGLDTQGKVLWETGPIGCSMIHGTDKFVPPPFLAPVPGGGFLAFYGDAPGGQCTVEKTSQDRLMALPLGIGQAAEPVLIEEVAGDRVSAIDAFPFPGSDDMGQTPIANQLSWQRAPDATGLFVELGLLTRGRARELSSVFL